MQETVHGVFFIISQFTQVFDLSCERSLIKQLNQLLLYATSKSLLYTQSLKILATANSVSIYLIWMICREGDGLVRAAMRDKQGSGDFVMRGERIE